MTPEWDGLLLDARLATMQANGTPYGLVEHGAIGWKDGTIVFAGAQSALPGDPSGLAARVESAQGALVTPGLVDCHTHLVFGGDRAHEFEQRLEGASYEEIARSGGGIASSVRATRAADDDALFAQSLPRAKALLADGVTTIEIKSGYGLDVDSELRMLRVARRLGETLGVGVRTTLLFANTRAQAELWHQALQSVWLEDPAMLALHHGSLDPALRQAVEAGLREGRVRCVVSTSSLELGVDFPAVDQVIQVGSPKGVARLLQRAGRARHRPGEAGQVLCVPTHALELLEYAAARSALRDGRIEARPGEPGQPTPEGVHRDGVDYVLVLLVDRHNIASGTTTIHAADGQLLGSFTLTHPLDAALVDDARVFHGVTAVEPLDPAAPSHRDVLVVTLRGSALA